MGLIHRASSQEGFISIVDRGRDGLEYLRFGLLRLRSGTWAGGTASDEEAAIVVLSGKCSLRSGSKHWENLGSRPDVFSGKATAVYVPAQCEFEIAATQAAEVALCWSARCPGPGEIAVVAPDDVKARTVGSPPWQRSVQDIIAANVAAKRLLVGETFNEPGNWSSYPPHKHDTEAMPDEVKQEEIYYFRINPAQGFGFQRIYASDGSLDEAYVIHDGDTIVIPRGYHPVAAAPGYSVYYLWMIAGTQRIMRPRDDPAHAWVKQLERKEPK